MYLKVTSRTGINISKDLQVSYGDILLRSNIPLAESDIDACILRGQLTECISPEHVAEQVPEVFAPSATRKRTKKVVSVE